MIDRGNPDPPQPPLGRGKRALRLPPGPRVPFLLFLPLLASSCSRPAPPRDLDVVADALYTTVTIRIPGAYGDPEAEEAAGAALAEMGRVENLLNFYDPASAISRLNHDRELTRDEMGEETWNLLQLCRELWKETDGAFDVSVGPLVELWKVGVEGEKPHVPSAEEIEAVRERVGLDKVIWEDDRVRLPEGMEIHLGGILKGYALDRAGAVLGDRGFPSALVNAGGDIIALGERAPGKKWRVGIRNPRPSAEISSASPGPEYFGRLEVSDEAVATSGDYFQFFEIGGKRYHHILDPRTGYPATGAISATVICPDAVRADAWATAAVVLGRRLPVVIRDLPEDRQTMQFVLVLEDGRVLASRGAPVASPLPGKLDW